MASLLRIVLAAGLTFSCSTVTPPPDDLPGGLSEQGAARGPVADATVAAKPAVRLFTELEVTRVSGYVDVREGPEGGAGSGTRMDLRDLGLETAEVLSLGALIPAGDDSDFRLRVRYWFLSGTGTFAEDVGFNGLVYEAGQPIDADILLVDFLADWRPTIWRFAEGGALRLLAGIDFTYLDFKTEGTLASGSPAADPSEGFYKQELPLPSLGLRVDYALSPDVALHAEAFGFRAIGWDSLRSEGGRVILSQDNFEAGLGAAFRLGDDWELEAGLRFGYLFMDEQSEEDGNVILLRDGGAFVGMRLRM